MNYDKAEREIAKKVFTEIIKGKNFMTPTVVRYGLSNGYAYELSEGWGFDNEAIWGVTCINAVTGNRQNHLDKMFYSLNEAEEHIRTLGER